MKVFQVLQFYLSFIGIDPLHKRFNCRHIEILLVIWLLSISAFAYLFFEASTPKEYAESFYASITVTSNAIGIVFQMGKTEDIVQLIAIVEETINNRT